MKSGIYTRTTEGHTLTARFDIDGDSPQNKASLSIDGPIGPAYWIADLSPDGNNYWEGDIWYRKDNAETLGVSSDEYISSHREDREVPDKMRVYYYGIYNGSYWIAIYLKKSGTDKYWWYWYSKQSDHFREVNVEFDHEAGVNPIFAFNPHDEPNRPASLPNENITVESAFQKAGVRLVRNTANEGSVATSLAGSNSKWSNAELHDAMQTQWSRDESAAWSMWVLQANRHEDDASGIMFDEIGNFHRCGTAIFHGFSSYSGLRASLVNRHKFHTLIHEIGHCFSLYHSWVKTTGTNTWCDRVANEPESKSFMNYPSRVAAGYYGYFDTFEYRFSDQELLFMRHAPEEFVKMGGRTWGVDHAGGGMGGVANESGEKPEVPELQLSVCSNKTKPAYEFLELVNLELKLTNTGDSPKSVPQGILDDVAHMNITVTRNGASAKEYKPYAVPCHKEDPQVTLEAGKSLTGEICLAGGKLGWVVDAPGIYTITVSLHVHAQEGELDLTAVPFTFSVAEPDKFDSQKRKEQEKVAGDYFSDEVGRTLAMGGTKVLAKANDTLNEVKEQLGGTKAAQQAELTLNLPNIRPFKTLQINADGSKTLNEDSPDDKAVESVKEIIVNQTDTITENLGAQTLEKLCEKVANDLSEQGNSETAQEIKEVADTLAKDAKQG